MDREIPLKERRKAALKRWMRIALPAAVILAAILVAVNMAGGKVDAAKLRLSKAETGDLQISVRASGSVVPEYQEIIASPISSRIVDVYKRTGDVVEEGEPLLKLDLQTTETDYRKGLDDEQMRRMQLEKLKVNQNTQLTDLKMKIEVAQMALRSKLLQLNNERYLDSIGSGTTEQVRRAELDYRTSKLELEQLRKQYENACRAAAAERRVQELDIEMFRKGLAESRRTLEDARIRAPRRAVLTYINNVIGAQVSQGEKVAIISDLGSYKVQCSIADGYSNRLAPGGRVLIHSGQMKLTGTVSNMNPQSHGGLIDFEVSIDGTDSRLRPGLNVEVYVLTAEKTNVLRIANGAFYEGEGTYSLFVKEGNKLVARQVRLGEASMDFIEVLGGLSPGEEVVVSDMERFKGKQSLRLN